MRFTAAILRELRQPLIFEELEVPRLDYGQVLVKVLTSGICGSQLGEIDGVKGEDPYLPHLLGHEGTAEVLECGPGVRHVKAGERVVMHWRKGAGSEASPPAYHHPTLGRVNAGWVTTFNRMAVVSENRVTRIPADFDPDLGALMGCAITTAFGVVNNDAQLKIGESVCVIGVGGVGLSVVQAAALVHAHPIVAVDKFPDKLELARKLGATHTYEAGADLSEFKFDAVIESTGLVSMIEQAYKWTSDRGRTILVGVPPKGHEARIYTLPLHFTKTLKGSHGGDAEPHQDIPRYVRLVQDGKLDFSPLISAHFPLEEANEAIAAIRSGAVAGRCLLTM